MTIERVMGVDAAGRMGWVAVLVDGSGFLGAEVGSLAELIQWAEPVAVVGVDIPIGNLPWGGRSAEAATRRFVGRRGSSVFSPPPAEVSTMASYAEANARLVEIGRPKLTRQAWALVPKIRETEAVARVDARVIEVFPEASFRAMAGEPVPWSKKTWNGQRHRRQLLNEAGVVVPDDVGPAGAVPADDLLDAAACAWSARRYSHGEAQALGDPGDRWAGGRRLAIWY